MGCDMPRRNRRAIAAPPLSNGVRHPRPVAVARVIHTGAARCSEFERAPDTASSRRHGWGGVGLRRGGSLDPPKFLENKLRPAPFLSSNKPCVPTSAEEEEPNGTKDGWVGISKDHAGQEPSLERSPARLTGEGLWLRIWGAAAAEWSPARREWEQAAARGRPRLPLPATEREREILAAA
jgi:hypothetical protein